MKSGHGQCDRDQTVDDVSESVNLGVETLAPPGAQDQTIEKLVCGTDPRRGRRQGKQGGPGVVGRGRTPEMGWENPVVGARTSEAGIENTEAVSLTKCEHYTAEVLSYLLFYDFRKQQCVSESGRASPFSLSGRTNVQMKMNVGY
jgi:hypothetical protein